MTGPDMPIAAALAEEKEVLFRADRAQLVGRLFGPAGKVKAAIVLHGATGVKQRYYRHFARWLAGQGYACLTYDYRDFGASGTGDLRRSKATMVDWGLRDQAAAQRALETATGDAPLWVIGHSMGGFMMPFQPDVAKVERLITVASGPVHLSDHPWPYRAAALAFWYGPPAWATGLLRYLPARAMRIGHDLPGGVYRQWRRWCTSREFYLGDVGRDLPVPDWKAFRGTLKAVAIADDDMIPPACVWRGMQNFPEAHKRQLVVRPAEYGLSKIGHLGVFKPECAAVWPRLLEEG